MRGGQTNTSDMSVLIADFLVCFYFEAEFYLMFTGRVAVCFDADGPLNLGTADTSCS